MLASLALTAAVATLTPNIAVEHARSMVVEAMGSNGQALFRKTTLKTAAPNLVFCGQVNTVGVEGQSGWKEVMIVVSGNPGLRAMVVDRGQLQRDMIHSVCGPAAPVDKRDYSAVLSLW